VKVNTILKLGSLALGVVQDEKVKELATMIHKGAKRRGLFAPQQQLMPPSAVPNAVNTQNAVPLAPPAAKPHIPFSPTNQFGSPLGGLEKYVTMDNAKKALDWAGMIKNLLVK
jgi:hypothetical protein